MVTNKSSSQDKELYPLVGNNGGPTSSVGLHEVLCRSPVEL